MTDESYGFIERFNSYIEGVAHLLFLPRDAGLQQEGISGLTHAMAEFAVEKAAAIAAGDEDKANLLLGFECVGGSLIAELRMWIALKEGGWEVAWDKLIEAQMATAAATRAHRGFHHLIQHANRLEAIEQLVFPPQVFMSAGLIVARQECSICGSEYGECDHLAGLPYMGRFCCIIARELTPHHVAVVDSPADKRCRATSFSVKGGKRDRMTWVVHPSSDTPSDEGMTVSAIIMRAD